MIPVNETVTYLTYNNAYTNGIGIALAVIGIFILFTMISFGRDDIDLIDDDDD